MFLLTALALAAGPDPLVVDARVATLPNGLRVVVERQDRTDEIGLHLHLGVGSRDERPGERGLAHLFEHLMFEGSENAPDNAYDALLAAAGGDNNAFTSQDETAYYATFPAGALDLALFLESDRLAFLAPTLSDASVSNQIDVVLEERALSYGAPRGRDFDALVRLLFPPDHPYHPAVIGTVQDIEATTSASATAFFERWYAPNNAVLGVVGRADPQRVLDRVAHWFADVPRRDVPDRVGLTDPPRRSGPVDGRIGDNVEDWTVHLGWPAVPLDHPDRAALEVAASILSDGRGTRLDDHYYRRGWLLGTRAQLWAGELDGLWMLSATVDEPGRLRRAERLLHREVHRLAVHPPSDREVERAQQRLRRGLQAAMERPASRAEVLVDCVRLFADPDCTRKLWERYRAVTPEQVSTAVSRVLGGSRARLWVAPVDRLDALPDLVADVELP